MEVTDLKEPGCINGRDPWDKGKSMPKYQTAASLATTLVETLSTPASFSNYLAH